MYEAAEKDSSKLPAYWQQSRQAFQVMKVFDGEEKTYLICTTPILTASNISTHRKWYQAEIWGSP